MSSDWSAEAAATSGGKVEEPERIVAAAIREAGVVYTGPHHHQIIRYMTALGLKNRMEGQGFITNQNRFVDRFEGLRIAKAAGQSPTPEWPAYAGADGDILFSEMLWSVPDSTFMGEPGVKVGAEEGLREENERLRKAAKEVLADVDAFIERHRGTTPGIESAASPAIQHLRAALAEKGEEKPR